MQADRGGNRARSQMGLPGAYCGTAVSFLRGFVGEQNSREIGTISTGDGAGADLAKRVPHGVEDLEPLGIEPAFRGHGLEGPGAHEASVSLAREDPLDDLVVRQTGELEPIRPRGAHAGLYQGMDLGLVPTEGGDPDGGHARTGQVAQLPEVGPLGKDHDGAAEGRQRDARDLLDDGRQYPDIGWRDRMAT